MLNNQVGLTKNTGWEIGVTSTVPSVDFKWLWKKILDRPLLQLWLGEIESDKFMLQKGFKYDLSDGRVGQIKGYNETSSMYKLRLRWSHPELQTESTLQVVVIAAKTGATIRFHQEKLSSQTERELMRSHWEQVIKEIKRYLQLDYK